MGAHPVLTFVWTTFMFAVSLLFERFMSRWWIFLLSVLQVTNEKLAVKMCRLELTPRNKDRWSREIMIMKKFVIFMAFPFSKVCWCVL